MTNYAELLENLPPAPPKPEKRMTYNGHQVFKVGRVTWYWTGEGTLEVGDKVWVSRPYFLPDYLPERTAEKVTKLGSRFQGALKPLSSRVLDKREPIG